MNVALLEDIKAHILARPGQFRMDTWQCDTAHCIGGWALQLSGVKIANPDSSAMIQVTSDGRYVGDAAAAILELFSDGNDAPEDRLFMLELWPEDLYDRYAASDSDEVKRAQVAAERIDRFVASGGAE